MKTKHGLALLPLMCIAIICIIACTKGILLHSYKHVASTGWARTDTLHFPLPPVPSDGNYSLHVGVRYNNEFPYQGIGMVVDMQLTQPVLLRRDTIFLALNDSSGMPLGLGGGLRQREVFLHRLPLHQGQSGTISLYHIMSRESLPCLHDVGIRLAH